MEQERILIGLLKEELDHQNSINRKYELLTELIDLLEVEGNVKQDNNKTTTCVDLEYVKVNFGKYNGMELNQIPSSYLRWCVENITKGEKFELVQKMKEYLPIRERIEESNTLHYEYIQENYEEDDNFSFTADDIPF